MTTLHLALALMLPGNEPYSNYAIAALGPEYEPVHQTVLRTLDPDEVWSLCPNRIGSRPEYAVGVWQSIQLVGAIFTDRYASARCVLTDRPEVRAMWIRNFWRLESLVSRLKGDIAEFGADEDSITSSVNFAKFQFASLGITLEDPNRFLVLDPQPINWTWEAKKRFSDFAMISFCTFDPLRP